MDTTAPTQQLDACPKEQSLDIEIPSITPLRPIPSSKPIDATILCEEGEALSTLENFVLSATKFGPELKKQSSLAAKLDTQIQGARKQLNQLKRKLQKASRSSKTSPQSPDPKNTKAAKTTTAPPPPQPARPSPPSLDGEQLAEIREKFRYDYRYVTEPRHVFRPIAPRDGPSLPREVESKRRRVERLTAMKRAVKQEIVAFVRRYETVAATDDDFPVQRLSAVPCQFSADVCSDRSLKFSIIRCRLKAEKEAKEWARKALADGDSASQV